MNVLILGDGPEELSWAQALAHHPDTRLVAAWPGLSAFPDVPTAEDLDAALATAEVDMAIVGGEPEVRAEALRRAAAAGLAIICLHPPGEGADPYYQVAMSRQETGAIIVPDLPLRLHPAVSALRAAIDKQELGPFRELRLEAPVGPEDGSLLEQVFPRLVDVIRALLGEPEDVTATGDPPGDDPTESLLVVLRGARGRRGEVRLWSGPAEPARLVLAGQNGTLTFEFDANCDSPARLVRRLPPAEERSIELGTWDGHSALLDVLHRAATETEVHPNLADGTRALELAEAAARSLRRGRTIELHFEQPSEVGNFKTLMTSTGCSLILCILVVLPLALVGPAFGLRWTLYLAYLIPPLLAVFLLLQAMRFALKKE